MRLNENLRYTIKFGNGVTGKKLNKGDLISIFYLRSDGPNGEIGPNTINGSRLFIYNSNLYSEIMSQIQPIGLNIINFDELTNINFVNSLASSKFTYHEDSENIKNNARNTYKSQYRLVNSTDFENYISKNFSNLIQDVRVVGNNDFINGHMQYLNEIGLSEPNLDSRILFNQVNFGTSCNFNNINIYCIPKVPQNENSGFNRFLNLELKNKIRPSICFCWFRNINTGRDRIKWFKPRYYIPNEISNKKGKKFIYKRQFNN